MLLSPILELSLHQSFHTVPCRKHKKVQTVRLSLTNLVLEGAVHAQTAVLSSPWEKSSLVSRGPTSRGELKTRAELCTVGVLLGIWREKRVMSTALYCPGEATCVTHKLAKDDKLPRASCSWNIHLFNILKCFTCKVFDRACSHRIEGMNVNEEIIYSPITMVFYDTSISTTQRYYVFIIFQYMV